MEDSLETQFHDCMLSIYRRAKDEAGYNAARFLRMLNEHGGLRTAHILIDASTVSDGYAALWERRRLDLTVEAIILDNERFHNLFSKRQLETCRARLRDYGYTT